MTKVHVDTGNSSKHTLTLFRGMTDEYKSVTEPISPALPSPTSVILGGRTNFNTNTFCLDFDKTKWLKSKIIDIDRRGTMSIVFSINDRDYYRWKCKIFFQKKCKINNKFLNVFLKPLINKHVRIKCYKMTSENILLIDLATNYSDPQNTTLLSDVIYSKYEKFIKLTKNKSKVIKLYDMFSNYVIKLYNRISEQFGEMYCDYLIDNVIEEKMTNFIASGDTK